MFFFDGIATGIIATLIFDLFQFSMLYAYGINKSKWDLIGRYFYYYLIEKKYFQENIISVLPIKNEIIYGYIVHYVIGAIFGLTYLVLNNIFFNIPSLFIALLVGFLTVLGSWCVMMPYAFNMGFFASKKEDQKKIMTQNLIVHFIFGIGLFIGHSILV